MTDPMLRDILGALDSDFQQTEPAELSRNQEDDQVKPGKYQAKITRAEVRTKKDSGEPYVLIKLLVITDPFKNARITSFAQLTTDKMPRTKALLQMLGISCLPSRLPEFIDQVVGKIVEINVVQGRDPDKPMIFINRLVKAAPPKDDF